MRNFVLAFVLLTFPAAPPCFGQATGKMPAAQAQTAPAVQRLRLGAVNVALPAPEGFVEASTQSERVKTIFTATEDPANEMLAVHVPAETLAAVKRGETPTPTFYTKVSVLKLTKETDTTPAFFASMISTFEKQGGKFFNPDDPDMRRRLKDIEARANALSETGAEMTFSQPEILGAFEKTPNVYSVLILARLNVSDGAKSVEVPMLAAASFVLVRSRVLFAYAYRKFDSATDAGLLKDFSKKWTDKIVAANRG